MHVQAWEWMKEREKCENNKDEVRASGYGWLEM